MKKNIFFILFLTMFILNIRSNEKDKTAEKKIYQFFSFSISNSNIIGFYNDNIPPERILGFDFWGGGISFDYIFSYKINNNYMLGISSSLGDSIYCGGLYLMIMGGAFVNKVIQKITFFNALRKFEKNKFTIIEIGGLVSFDIILGFNSGALYCSLFLSPYLFIGYQVILKNNITSHIIGGSIDFPIDVGKYTSEDNFRYFAANMVYLRFGFEYRIGHTLLKSTKTKL